ncbi:DUF4123 domain-containing protein [Massilia atriviolacea]|nr:DUF4123 domain-containing protein [Massilia atriviolacea]
MEMFFAVDPIAPDFADDLLDAFALAKRRNGKLALFALIDTSFEYANPRPGRPVWKGQETSLYRGSELDALANAAPCLFKLGDGHRLARVHIQRLVETCNGKPMLSFVASELDSSLLANTFQDFLEVKTVDQQQFVLRFADTRILAGLDAVLLAEATYGWRMGIVHWWLPDRKGALSELPALTCNEDDYCRAKNVLVLSQYGFNQLVDHGEIDAILNAIADQNPALLSTVLPSDNYCLIQRLLIQTNRLAIKSFPDVVMFCTTAMFTSEYFYLHPRFEQVLASKIWTPGELGNAFLAIDDACWAEAESMGAQTKTVY